MKSTLTIDELLLLARLSQEAFDKPMKFMDRIDMELINRYKKIVTPELIEELCLEIKQLREKAG
ncbi:TPA: hypothetical protein LTW56_004413 [Enterobacter cloacae]|nr:hypothetical protein [Enterobacter cloacae]